MFEVTNEKIIMGLALTLFAGLSTGIGSCIAFFSRHSDRKFLTGSLGFSAGVMVYISLAELLPEANRALTESYGKRPGQFYAILAFFGGIALAMLIDRLIPEAENPHEVKRIEQYHVKKSDRHLMRSGLLFALALGIHNFPEGMATFVSSLSDTTMGVSIAIAVAIHNIPEGITVSVPIYYATGSKRKAFFWSFMSGLAEPLGALVAYFVLMPFLSGALLAAIFAAVAGIMVFISFDELLPLAETYGHHHLCIYGLIGGMLVMALSLALF